MLTAWSMAAWRLSTPEVMRKASKPWFGGMLLERKHPVLREYLERELRIRNEILDRLKNAPNAEKRAGEIEEEKQAVIAALEEYEGI